MKVFEFYAREESLIVNFEEFDDETDGLKLGKQILGKSIWVNWPHLELALVSAINTRNAKYILGRDNLIIKGELCCVLCKYKFLRFSWTHQMQK